MQGHVRQTEQSRPLICVTSEQKGWDHWLNLPGFNISYSQYWLGDWSGGGYNESALFETMAPALHQLVTINTLQSSPLCR